MKIVMLNGQNHKGSSYTIGKKIIDKIDGEKEVREFFFPKDLNHFCIGIAGYPEKHFESPNLGIDLHYLKQKVELGADYIVTQMFFDNQKYFDFVRKCREMDINIPIIPGIKPLTTLNQLTSIPQNFYIDLPENLALEVLKAKNNERIKEIGIEWCINQCKELIDFGVPSLHFYTMSNSINTKKIAETIF